MALAAVISCSGIQPRYYTVQPGDSLVGISSQYDVPVEQLKRYNSPRLAKGLRPGEKLYIPFEESPNWDSPADVVEGNPVNPGRAPANDNGGEGIASFNWPVSGFLSSPFGMRHHKMHEGIDIAARKGTPVKASRSGHVIYASNVISGYGKMVIIRHIDSYSTVYAHLSKIKVKKGQFISAGPIDWPSWKNRPCHWSPSAFRSPKPQSPRRSPFVLAGAVRN